MSQARPAGVLLARALCAFVVFALPAVVLGILLTRGIDPKAQPDLLVERMLGAQFAGCVALLLFAAVAPPHARFSIDLRMAARTVAAYLGFLVLWVLLLIAYAWAMQMLGRAVTEQEHLRYFVRPHPFGAAFVLVLVTACVIGPIAEEVLFRGHVTDALVALLGDTRGNLACAVLFGLMHGADKAAPLALLGYLFGRLRHISGSLAPPVLAHILHNTLTVALAMLDPRLLDKLTR